jgi:hypothetical protein
VIFTAASSRSSRFRILFASVIGLLIVGLMSLWMSAPASAAGTSTVTLKLLSKAGTVLSDYDVYPIALNADGTAVGFQDLPAATPAVGKPGYYQMTLIQDDTYTALLVPNGASANSGTVQYLGGTPTIAGATTFTPGTLTDFLTASIATGGTISGKVTSPSGGALKGAAVVEYEYDGTQWFTNNYTTTSSSGAYTFTAVDPGSYKFEFYPPTGQYPPIYSGGSTTLAAATPTFVAAGATATVNQKFTAGTGTISGTAFLNTTDDDNEYYDGKLTPAAFPVTSAVGLATTIDTDKGVDGAESSSKGAWSIKNLPAGRYVVQMEPYYGGEYAEYLTGSSDDDTADLSSAAVYTVTAGKTTKTGTTEFTGRDETLGAEPNITVHDSSNNDALSGVLVQVSPETAPSEDIYGTSSSTGSVQLYFDAADPVADNENQITANGPFPLTPGWYDIAVVDPTGAHEPQKLHEFLDFGGTNIPVQLEETTVDPSAYAGTIANTDTTIGNKYTVTGASAGRNDATLSYQWLRNGSPIYGATTTSYTATGGDLGEQLSVRVTASSFGYKDVSDVAYVGGADGNPETQADAPVAVTDPSISGDDAQVVGTTLNVSPGEWQVDGTDIQGLHYSYQWTMYDGTNHVIAGATSPSYTIPLTDAGDSFFATVTVSKAGYAAAASVDTNHVFGNPAPAPVNTKLPTVTSTTKSGVTTYTGTNGSWNESGLEFDYQWQLEPGDSIGTSNTNTITSTEIDAAYGSNPHTSPLLFLVLARIPNSTQAVAEVTVKSGTTQDLQLEPPTVTDLTSNTALTGSTDVYDGDKLKVTQSGIWASALVGGDTKYTYQWFRNGTAIKGATSTSYTVSTADTTTSGPATELSIIETTTSKTYTDPTASSVIPVASVANHAYADGATATLSGEPIAGQPVTVTAAGLGVTSPTLSYQWFECADVCGDSTDPSDYSVVAGATKSSFTPATTYSGYLYAEVTAYKAGYGDDVLDTAPAQVGVAGSYYASVAPSFTGTSAVGKKLTAVAPKWSTSGIVNHYVWETQECAPGSCSDDGWTPIAGATLSTYTPTAADYGDGGVSIRLEDLGTQGSGDGNAVYSAPQAIALGTVTVTKAPKITVSNGSYNVSVGTYSVTGGTTTDVIYVDDAGSQGPSLGTSPSDTGKAVYAIVEYGVTGYQPLFTTVVYQKGTTAISEDGLTGDDVVGGTLSPAIAEPFSNASSAPYVLAYQWYASGTAISGTAGKGSTLVLTSADYGKKITLKMTGTSNLYATGTVTTTATPAIGKGSIPMTPTVAITSPTTLEAGVVASVSIGAWGITGVVPTYQWLRSTDGGTTFTPISGATKSTYTPVATDGGDELEVTVTGTKTDYTAEPRTSDPADIQYPTDLAVLAPPTLTGTTQVGDPLTVSSGIWNVPSLSYTYQWFRNGVLIPGVTGTTWTPTATSVGDEVTVKVTASRTGYATVKAPSAAVTVELSTLLNDTFAPTITQSGNLLTVVVGPESVDGVTYEYQWTTDNGIIVGQHGETYTINGDEGGGLGVQVTAIRDGYVTASIFLPAP